MITITMKLTNPPAGSTVWFFGWGAQTPYTTYHASWKWSTLALVTDSLTVDMAATDYYLRIAVATKSGIAAEYQYETTTRWTFTDGATYIWDARSNSLSLEKPTLSPLKPIDVIFSRIWDFSLAVDNWADNIWTWIPGYTWFTSRLHDIAGWLWGLLTPIGKVGVWVDDAVTKIAGILGAADITTLLKTWLTYAEDAWEWVKDATTTIGTAINTFAATFLITINGLIATALETATELIAAVGSSLATLQTAWDDFALKIPDLDEVLTWFEDWWAKILALLTTWWGERLKEIQTLVTSTLKEWFPAYTTEEEQRPTRISFFINPLDWLAGKLEDWFWGKES